MQKGFAGIAFLFFLNLLAAPLLAQKMPEQKVISGSILLNDKTAPDSKMLINALKTTWKLRVDSAVMADKTLVFNSSGGASVMIAYLDYPAARDEIGAAARLSWLWPTANQETAAHKAQVVISVIGNPGRALDLYKIFTQAAGAVLEVTHAPAVYMDSEYLLLSSGYYSAAARNMVQNQTIPLYCWVYFGRPGPGGGFTYGMPEFGLPEMEIAQSGHSEAEVHAVLYDAAMTVVKSGMTPQEGQTLTTEEGSKIKGNYAKSTFLDNQKVFKLDF